MQENRLATVTNLQGLASVLGCTARQLGYYLYKLPEDYQYKVFDIPKRGGGSRTICAPKSNLKIIQRSIARELSSVRPFHRSVNGFVSERGIVTNGKLHAARGFVLNFDLIDFFSSVNFGRVYGILQAKPYNCRPKIAAMIAKACTFRGVLPQGAPSSPIITNMICARMDREFFDFAKRERLFYSRYADDITFSSRSSNYDRIAEAAFDIDRGSKSVSVSEEINRIVWSNGFEINPRKTRVSERTSRQEVTGLIVNKKLNVKRRYVRQIRAMLHAWKKYGFTDAQDEYNSKYSLTTDSLDFARVLHGKISFLSQIRGKDDPVFLKYAVKFNQISSGIKINLTLTPVERMQAATWVCESLDSADHPMQGTAFFADGIGIVTCFHCIGREAPIGDEVLEIYHPRSPSEKFRIHLRDFDAHKDLAIMDIPDELAHVPCLTTQVSRVLSEGEEVCLIGYPNHQAWMPVRVERGQLIRKFIRSGLQHIEIGPRIVEGNSGGPVCDGDGLIIGMACRGANYDTPSNVAQHFALDAREITTG